jgi:hypothetical protein
VEVDEPPAFLIKTVILNRFDDLLGRSGGIIAHHAPKLSLDPKDTSLHTAIVSDLGRLYTEN